MGTFSPTSSRTGLRQRDASQRVLQLPRRVYRSCRHHHPHGRRNRTLVTCMSAPMKWVIAAPKKTLVVGVADMVVSNDAGSEIVTYSLGSCLGITVYDPAKKVGGLLHLMLPDSSIDSEKAVKAPFMFV